MYRLIRKSVFALLFTFSTVAASLAADGILPPEQGKHSVPFILADTVAPFPTGARVEFVATAEKEAPRHLRIFGIVLGMRDSVVFVELSERDAVRLTRTKVTETVRAIKVGEPDENLVAERRRLGDAGEVVQLAPSMRMFTVRVPSEQGNVGTWQRGDTLVFRDVLRGPNYRLVEGAFFKSGPARAILLAVEPVPGGYKLDLLSDPSDAPEIVMADAEGRLNLERVGEAQAAKTSERKRCHIRRRHGEDVISVEIPCSD